MVKTETIIFILSLFASSMALIFEFIGFAPCHLCLYQRFIYYSIIASYLVCYLIRERINKNFLLNCYRFILLVGFILSSYHILVEKQIINPSKSCQGLPELPNDISLAMNFLENSKSIAVCTVPTYIIPFLSLAELNLIFSLILLIISFKRVYDFTRG